MPNVFSMVKRVTPTELQVGEWVLPFDVVSDIMAISLPSTISALMKTCHVLYTEGPKHLLCGGVQLDRSRDIVSFANFMLVEDPSRFAHLRKLVLALAVSHGPFVYQGRLVELLVHPSLALETLILHHTDNFLGQSDSESSLHEAFRGLKTIKHLVVFGIEKRSAKFIESIPSPLASVSIRVNTYFHPPDIAQMLTPFSNTLHTLLIYSDNIPVWQLFEHLGPRDFARVRTFGVVCASGDRPGRWPCPDPEHVGRLLTSPAFALAFPGIKHLQLIPTIAHPSRTHTPGMLTYEELAQNDGSSGSSLPMPRDPPPRPIYESSPPAVEECSGELLSVYTLGLKCPLTTLRLWLPIQTDDLAILRAVLEETRPRRFCLPTTVGDFVNLFDTFHALQTQAPARIDLFIMGSWVPNGVQLDSASSEKATNKLYSILEPLFTRPPLYGLVELNLLFKAADRGRARPQDALAPMLGNVGEAFVRWASTGNPPPTVSWRFYNEDELRWPDVGQSLDEAYNDDEDSVYNNDYEHELYDPEDDDSDPWYNGNSDELEDDTFLEVHGDEYSYEEWAPGRWDDDY